LKKLYELLEDVRDTVAERFASGYSLDSLYRALMYALVYAALQRRSGRLELLKPLERRVPQPLLAVVKRELVGKLYHLLEQVDLILASSRPVLVHGEADFRHVIESVKREVGRVDYVLVYDCMSLVELLSISAFLKVKGVKPVFLNTVFVNPIGVTRFVTQQLYGTRYHVSLLGVAKYVANELGALLFMKSSFIDEKVHEVGLLGVEEFVDKVNIERVAREALERARSGRVLILSDHGYDVVASVHENYIYVTHGFSYGGSSSYIPLVLLSRITFFIEAYRVV